jgi:hypothetical protein
MDTMMIIVNGVELRVERVISLGVYELVGGTVVAIGEDGEYHRAPEYEVVSITSSAIHVITEDDIKEVQKRKGVR